MARKLVIVTRASPYRRWHDEAALHALLRTFGRAVNMSVTVVDFGALGEAVCEQVRRQGRVGERRP